MHYLPKYFPPFVKLLSAIAKKGNKYKGSDMTRLTLEDKARLGEIVSQIQIWVADNPGLLRKSGIYPERAIFFEFDNKKTASK